MQSQHRIYSVTEDLISFKRCPRQYGYLRVKKFVPSSFTQLYYGTLLHRVMHRIFLHYKSKGRSPTTKDVGEIIDEVHENLIRIGIIPISLRHKDRVKNQIIRFYELIGEWLLPRILYSEVRLTLSSPRYSIEGIADVILRDGNEGRLQLWDYKASARPKDESVRELNKLQARIYALMYYKAYVKSMDQVAPDPIQVVICYINEADRKLRGKEIDEVISQIADVYDFDGIFDADIENELNSIINEIENSRSKGKWEASKDVDKATCDICDFRWDCPQRKGEYKHPFRQ